MTPPSLQQNRKIAPPATKPTQSGPGVLTDAGSLRWSPALRISALAPSPEPAGGLRLDVYIGAFNRSAAARKRSGSGFGNHSYYIKLRANGWSNARLNFDQRQDFYICQMGKVVLAESQQTPRRRDLVARDLVHFPATFLNPITSKLAWRELDSKRIRLDTGTKGKTPRRAVLLRFKYQPRYVVAPRRQSIAGC